jgi:hypothetical protein
MNDHGAWNVQLLQQYFLLIDVDEIMKIKASPRLDKDVLA